MKKFSLILFISILISVISVSVYAMDNENSKYEAYGLCVVSKILEYDEDFDMNKIIDLNTYSEIMSFWFGNIPDTNINPTNSDAVYALSAYAPVRAANPNTLTAFRDYGFIKKEHRDAYKIMCNAGFLNYKGEYLKPNYPLTYGVFFDMLIHFEDEFVFRNGFNVSEGLITDSFSEANDIIIKQNAANKEAEFRFNRMHSFYVQADDKLSAYSYNIKRGNNAKIYLLDDSIVYVSIKNENGSFNNKYDITSARLFLCNPYENKIIFTNIKTGNYMVYTYDGDILIYENKTKLSYEDINNYYTDRICYIISEKNNNKIKYINITG